MSLNETILERHETYLQAMQDYRDGAVSLQTLYLSCQRLFYAFSGEWQATATFKTVKQLTEKEFMQLEAGLRKTPSKDILSKQEKILAKYGIAEADFVIPYATWADLASFIKNSFEGNPNEYFVEHLRTYLLVAAPEVELEKTKSRQASDNKDRRIPC